MGFGNFGHRIEAVQNVFPILFEAFGFGIETRHADDGNVAGRLGRLGGHDFRSQSLELGEASLANARVQFLHGHHAVVHGGDLADHVHPAGELLLIGDLRELRRAGFVLDAVQPFGRHAEPADVHPFEGLGDFLVGFALGFQRAAFLCGTPRNKAC